MLANRLAAQRRLDAGAQFNFPLETVHIRADPSWVCATPAPGLEDRRVEITGPTDRKMVVNALNSGAKTFMADFEGGYLSFYSHSVFGSTESVSDRCVPCMAKADLVDPALHTTDSNCPAFYNLVNGQVNLRDAIRHQIDFEQGGKQYKLTQNPATLIVRCVGNPL